MKDLAPKQSETYSLVMWNNVLWIWSFRHNTLFPGDCKRNMQSFISLKLAFDWTWIKFPTFSQNDYAMANQYGPCHTVIK